MQKNELCKKDFTFTQANLIVFMVGFRCCQQPVWNSNGWYHVKISANYSTYKLVK